MIRPLGNAFGTTANAKPGSRNNQQPGSPPNLNSCYCAPSCGTYSRSGDIRECRGRRIAMQWVLVSTYCIPYSSGLRFPNRSLRTPPAQFPTLPVRKAALSISTAPDGELISLTVCNVISLRVVELITLYGENMACQWTYAGNLYADLSSRVRSRAQLATAIWLAAESVQGERFGQRSLGIVPE